MEKTTLSAKNDGKNIWCAVDWEYDTQTVSVYVGPSSSHCSLSLRDHPRSLVKEPEAKLSPSCSFHLGRGVSPISRDAVQQLCAQLSYIVEWLIQFCFNVGPASQTLAQHWSIIGWRSRVFWDSGTRTAPLQHTQPVSIRAAMNNWPDLTSRWQWDALNLWDSSRDLSRHGIHNPRQDVSSATTESRKPGHDSGPRRWSTKCLGHHRDERGWCRWRHPAS